VKRLVRAITPILLAFAIYIVYTGAVRLYDIVTGIVSAIALGIIMAPLLVEDWRKSLDVRRLLHFTLYVFRYFLIHEVKAHLNVIKMGLSPTMPIRPGIVRVPIGSRNEYSITMVSIAITNTPGTVVVDLNKERGILYVHWIYVKDVKPEVTYREIAWDFNRYAKKIFE